MALKKRIRVVYKERPTHDYDKDCFPLDAHLDGHVNGIWQMMIAEHPELADSSNTGSQDVQEGSGASNPPPEGIR